MVEPLFDFLLHAALALGSETPHTKGFVGVHASALAFGKADIKLTP